MAVSVFARQQETLFQEYRVRLEFRDRIYGGCPSDPKIIEGWLRSKAGISVETEVQQAVLRTLRELGHDIDPDATYEQVSEAIREVADERQVNRFKTDDDGLYVEGRQVKAMLKECCNIMFAGERWGRTKKGPRNFLAERIFVKPDRIHLGALAPSGIDTFVCHTVGRDGPRSSLNAVEYVVHPTVEFVVWSLNNEVTEDQWASIWVAAQENGLGARRSQQGGQFDVTLWERA